MDLFQPVTLLLSEDGETRRSISYAHLRLAVLSVMKELAPGERETALIRAKDGEIDFPGIVQLFEALRPTRTIAAASY